MNELTSKQQRFVNEYLIDLNGKQAAIRAGYSPATAENQASRLLSYGKVSEYLKLKAQSVADKLGIDAMYVLGGIKKIADITTATDEFHNPQAANKALEMLGKHLRLFGDDDKKQPTNVTIQIVNF